jgi:hypothetical protein
VFIPGSACAEQYPELLLQQAGGFPLALHTLTSLVGKATMQYRRCAEFATDLSETLGKELNTQGSDKSSKHNYHLLYSGIIDPTRPMQLLEIGLGTNNPTLVSNMGAAGVPGASLRAFRNVYPNLTAFGADIDTDILFTEDRIQTSYVDQVNPSTFDALFPGQTFDVIIDDGLHSIGANLNTLNFGLSRINVGGYVVIEDIPRSISTLLKVWEAIDCIIRSNDDYESYMVEGKASNLYVVKRLR